MHIVWWCVSHLHIGCTIASDTHAYVLCGDVCCICISIACEYVVHMQSKLGRSSSDSPKLGFAYVTYTPTDPKCINAGIKDGGFCGGTQHHHSAGAGHRHEETF